MQSGGIGFEDEPEPQWQALSRGRVPSACKRTDNLGLIEEHVPERPAIGLVI
jgi:hypothetical protein